MNHSSTSCWSGLCLAVLAIGVSLLTGCGSAAFSTVSEGTFTGALQGRTMGGQQPVSGALISFYSTTNNGVATSGGYVGTAHLLGTTTTDSTGVFQFATPLSCSDPDQVYVTASGGDPGLGAVNPNLLLMAAVGACRNLGASTYVNINELTTVAAAYALRSFISLNGTTVNVTSSVTNYAGVSGVGTATSAAGLQHAFANAANLVNATTGLANAVTPSNTTGIVPQAEINTLGNILQSCVNTSGGVASNTSTVCGKLFSYTTPPVAGSVAPTNTLQATLNTARYPANNVSNLFLLSSATPAFVPSLTGTSTTAINVFDWTLSILYQTPSSSSGPALPAITYPYWLALDANDNVYVDNWSSASSPTSANIVSLGGDGTYRYATATSTTIKNPIGIAADSLGNFWVANNAANPGSLVQFRASDGTLLNTYTFAAGTSNTKPLAVDSHNNIWAGTASPSTKSLLELAYNATLGTWSVNTANQYILTAAPYWIAVDANQNIWATGFTPSSGVGQTMGILPNTGTAAAPAYSGVLNVSISPNTSPEGVVFDASGNAWVDIYGGGNRTTGILQMTPTGSPVTGATLGTFASGTGASASATISGGVVTSITVTSGGSGYTSAPTVAITNGGYTTAATATAIISGGAVTGFNITNPGAGFTYAPLVAIAASPTEYQFGAASVNAIDGAGRIYSPDASGGVHVYDSVNSLFVSPSGGVKSCEIQLSSYHCNQSGASSAVTVPRIVAIDSSGAMWTPNDSGSSGALDIPAVVQTFGVASPAWPLLASGKWGVMP